MSRKWGSRILTAVLALILAMVMLSPGVTMVARAEGDNLVKSVIYKSNGETLQPNADGSYTVELNKNYEVDLAFEESEGNQFPADQFVYHLPSGINPVASEGDLAIEFSVVDTDGHVTKRTLSGNHYTIAADGTITVTWNMAGGEAYTAFEDCGNVGFTLTFSGSFNGQSTELTFSDTVETTIKVDDTADVLIEKSGTYNPATNKVEYTAKVTGKKGTNHNVVVTDELKGTALKLDTGSIAVSKTPDTAADPVQQSATEDGFRYNIPVVNAGEIYTFTYTASVDIDKITGDGTVEQTENDISIKSDEHPDPDTVTTDLKNGIHYTDLSKDVEIVSESDDEAVLKWTIKYGDKENSASLGGFTLKDTLDTQKTGRLFYDTTGHTGITVQENDGTPYTVSWADVGVTTGEEKTWSWTIPENAPGNTEYTITYYTVFDKKDLVTKVYPTNRIDDGHEHKVEKGIDIGTGDIGLEKRITGLSSTEQTATWSIKITVPASGLKTAFLRDYYPNRTINGKQYTDTLHPGSVSVSGLLDGEAYDLVTIDGRLRINFSSDYSDGGTTYALKPSSESRTITVTLKTDLNQEWLKASQNSDDSKDRVHTNGVSFFGNGQRLWSQDFFSTNEKAIKKTVENDGDPVGYVESPYNSLSLYKPATEQHTDSALPVWQFMIAVDSVYGDLDITEKFDTDLFEIVPETIEGEGDTYNRWVFGINPKYCRDINGEISKVTVTPTSDGANLHISRDRLPKYQDNPDLYYARYYVVYYLKVKSPEALQKLRERCAEQGENLKATLKNEATYEGKTASADYYYTYEGVRKEIVNEGYVDPADGYTYADFKIVLNPTGAEMDADSDTLTASDTWSDSLAVKPDSFVFKDSAGNDISDRVSYDIAGHTATFKIPDATAVTVTYRARILGSGEIDYNNTATMKGYLAGKSAQATVTSSGGGSGSVFTIYLLKYAEGNLNQHLAGATFSLYRLDASGKKVPVKDKDGNTVSFTTDDSGEARIFGSQTADGWSLNENIQYYLREETAPAGFSKRSEDYAFRVSKTTQDWENHLYINGDTILIPNEKVTELEFTKVWEDQEDKDGVRPSADPQSDQYFGKWLHLYQTVNGVEKEVSGYKPVVTVDASDSSKWTVRYENLPVIDGSYSVKEVIPKGTGYTADYGSQNRTSVANKGTLTNRRAETVSIPVLKKWADGAKGDKAVIILTANGKKTEKTLELTEAGKWKGSFRYLPKYDQDGNEIEYGVTEDGKDWKFTVEPDGNGGFIVTNRPKDTPKTPGTTGNVKTGDSGAPAAYAFIGVCAAAALIGIQARRRRRTR